MKEYFCHSCEMFFEVMEHEDIRECVFCGSHEIELSRCIYLCDRCGTEVDVQYGESVECPSCGHKISPL